MTPMSENSNARAVITMLSTAPNDVALGRPAVTRSHVAGQADGHDGFAIGPFASIVRTATTGVQARVTADPSLGPRTTQMAGRADDCADDLPLSTSSVTALMPNPGDSPLATSTLLKLTTPSFSLAPEARTRALGRRNPSVSGTSAPSKHSSTYGRGGSRACPRRKPKDVSGPLTEAFELPGHQPGGRSLTSVFAVTAKISRIVADWTRGQRQLPSVIKAAAALATLAFCLSSTSSFAQSFDETMRFILTGTTTENYVAFTRPELSLTTTITDLNSNDCTFDYKQTAQGYAVPFLVYQLFPSADMSGNSPPGLGSPLTYEGHVSLNAINTWSLGENGLVRLGGTSETVNTFRLSIPGHEADRTCTDCQISVPDTIDPTRWQKAVDYLKAQYCRGSTSAF